MEDPWFVKEMQEAGRQRRRKEAEESEMQSFRDRLSSLDARSLTSMSDVQLAEWQSHFPDNSPQKRLADYEWQRRLTVMQVKSARFAAWLGLVGVVVGSLLTFLITEFLG